MSIFMRRRPALAFLALAAALTAAAFASGPIGDQARLIDVPNSSVVLALWEEADARGTTVPYYGISLDGRDFVRTAQAWYEIGLRYAHFDPLVAEPTVAPELAADASTHLFIVQFVTQPMEVFAAAIEAAGGTIRQYVARQAYLVEMDSAARLQVAQLPYVRWVGPYHPAYRIEEFLRDNYAVAAAAYPMLRYNIRVMAVEQKLPVAERIEALGGVVDNASAGKLIIEATLTPDELFQVIRWDEVLFADRWGEYETDMNNIRVIGGANYLESVTGFTGEGVRGEVFDAGFNLIHQDFQSRPLIQHGTVGTDSHGASTSGICFGDGTGQPIARGLLPAGQGVVADYHYTSMTGTGRYYHTGELILPPYEVVFQTASVGSPQTTQYNNFSADTDDMLFDFDIVHCQSQSNTGNRNSRPQAWAKNIISVGAAYHYDNTNMADDCWCGGASIGPASDNRIKPDFCQAYDATYTTSCCSYSSYTPSFGGTSGATPIVAGHVGLFHQMWSEGIFGNEVIPGGTVFENRPHMTTPKAVLAVSAKQYDFAGLTHDKTRCHQGWGVPNLQTLYDYREQLYVVDQSDVLEPFEIATHLIDVGEADVLLKIAMVYPDPPGNPAVQTMHRVNDLSLRVVSPTGTVYYGNNGLYESPWSSAGGCADILNTVECVFINGPEAGRWTIEISADEIVQDGFVATEELDAVYSLAVMGGTSVDWSSTGDARALAESKLSLRLLSANPANAMRLAYALPSPTSVRLTVHDVTGRTVATLTDQVMAAGAHEVAWNGRDDAGSSVRPGVYFARLAAAGQETSRKLLLVQ